MKALIRIAAAGIAALGLSWSVADAAPEAVAEPSGFWTGPMHGHTPPGLAGAQAIDADGLARLSARERPVIIDVAGNEPRPAGLPPGALWRPIHRSIPGSVWMPGAGAGRLDPVQTKAFTARVAALAAGGRDRPVVTFCHRDCWASWNAAKRLVLAGYSRVYWLRDGVEGWQEAGEGTSVVTKDPVWTSAAEPTP